MTTLRRVLVVILFSLIVLVFWARVAKTPWGHTVNPFTAGRRYPDPISPILHIAVVIGIVTPSVILLRSAWKWFSRSVLGRQPRRRIPPRPSVERDTSRTP
jgi:hypothetical protein